jgi:predicted phage baseplate assembly protein
MIVGLRVGRWVVVSGIAVGEDGRPSDLPRSEAVRLGAIMHEAGHTTLYFENALQNRYLRSTVEIAANVAPATHGQTVASEILGGGNAAARGQSFTLQKPPLTWVSAPNANGRASTLTVRVDDLAWTEVPTLYGLAPDDRSYALRTSDDGRTSVVFGNGVQGARLPTGTGNVTASYRSGIGLAGQVPAQSLTTLMSRPLGLKEVKNPLPADGAADPEPRDRARDNAPISVLTLGRVVSLLDYQSFARAFAGVGKAQGVALWDGHAELVHLTIAGADGSPPAPGSALVTHLVAALVAAGDGRARVRADGFAPRYFEVEASVAVDPAADPNRVLLDVEALLKAHFAFETRSFGQRVTGAEVMTVIQSVPYVGACIITSLAALDDEGAPLTTGVTAVLPAERARFTARGVAVAELLLLSPTGVKLSIAGVPK